MRHYLNILSTLLTKLLITLNFCYSDSFSQPNKSWPDSGAIWAIGKGASADPDVCFSTFCYFNAGDTMIDSNTYIKINVHNYSVTGGGSCYPNCIAFDNCGFLREDSLTKKVYYRFNGDATDSLLYDYNLQLNDTVTGFLAGWYGNGSGCWMVDSIDSILVKNIYHKRWLLNTDGFPCYGPNAINAIIEGIGSTWGLLEYFSYFEYGSTLWCVKDTTGTIYLDNQGDSTSCNIITSENKISDSKDRSKLFPNPCNGSFNISIPSEYIPSKITIYNMLGSTIWKSRVNSELTTINIPDIPAGLYYFVLDSEGGNYRTKFIIQK